MIFQTDRIKQDVRSMMDENRVTTSLLSASDEDTLMLDDLIESKILEGVERIHSAAPYRLLQQGHNFSGAATNVYWGNQESGWVLLPRDYMRLVVFEMSDWARPVYTPISTADPQYRLQRSRLKALRGTAQKPVCAEVVRPEGKALEFYSCVTNKATITKAVYMPYPTIDSNGGVDISEHCYPAVVQTIAGLVLTSCGESDKAKLFFDMANTFLEK